MTKIDPIIAVKDVEASSLWYQKIFGCKSMHSGKKFDILTNENDEVLLCLHKWEEDGHPTMMNPEVTPGNGLILYMRTENMEMIHQKVEKAGVIIIEDIHLNQNSLRKEFSIKDPDGYYITITEFHQFEG